MHSNNYPYTSHTDNIKKRLEVESAAENLNQFTVQRKHKKEAEKEEKKQSYEQLMSYQPWGKPGGGAPTGNTSRTVPRSKMEASPFGKPGGGAPMKSNSGKLKAYTHSDPEIQFQKRERGQVIDVVSPNPLKHSTKNSLVTDLESEARRSREERQVMQRSNGTGKTASSWNSDETLPSEPRWWEENEYQYYDPFGRPGAGAPIKDSAGKVRTTRIVSVATNHLPPKVSEENLFFGKPGAGAPIRDSNGRVVTNRTHNLAQTVQETDPKSDIKKFKNQPRWNAYLKKQHNAGHQEANREEQRRYNEELEQLARMREAQKENEVQLERRASLEHANKWNSIWGKPGAGAPMAGNRRQKFDVDIYA